VIDNTGTSAAGFVCCSTCTVSHLPRARVAARSWREHHPDSRFFLLLLDGDEWPVAGEPFEVVRPEELRLSPQELAIQEGIYDAYELACALRPHLLHLLLDRGASAVVFTDTDTCFYGPVDDLAQTAKSAGLVLAPAAMRPVAPRRYFPTSEMEYRRLMNGLFNAGLLAVGSGGNEFLDWWAGWLARDALNERTAGMWTDQLWIDWAPVYFEPVILRDKSLNVTFWSLDERELHEVEGRPMLDDVPLRHFHFVGFDPRQPDLFFTHYPGMADYYRHTYGREAPPLPPNPVLALVLRQYTDRLLEAGSEELRERAYGFSLSAGGRHLDRRERAIYREAVLAAEARGSDLPPNPFDPSEIDEFERLADDPAWLRTLSPQAQRRLEHLRPPGLSPSSFARVSRRLVAAARYALTGRPLPDPGNRRVASDVVRLEY
jgi:hypothetical protein